MVWIDVDSSNVAKIGYDADTLTLGVRYRDGHLYIRPNISVATYGALMASPSKGKFLAELSGPAIKIHSSGAGEPVKLREPAAPAAAPAALVTHDESECCGKLQIGRASCRERV